MVVIKNNQKVQRRVVNLGEDQFCIDEDLEVYHNGFGMLYVKKFLHYKKGGIRRKVEFRKLFDLLYVENILPKEAVRRVILHDDWAILNPNQRRAKLHAANVAKRKRIVRSDRRVFKSMTKAAIELGCLTSTISKAVKNNWSVQGYKFRLE